MEEFRAIIYLRISKEDGFIESNSIVNQRELIKSFLKMRKDISLYSEKVDDGYSGSNFNRPGFMEMLEELKEGKANCIIVKDLSRFGRNYIESGRYIEKLFPFLGVRFIAINDNYDSQYSHVGSSEILIPFKNLINDAYCKDLSIKIKSQLDIKRKNGEFVGAFPTYGYKKSSKNKNELIIDQYPAEIVKDVFRWKIQGLSYRKIANRLNQYGILSPMEYKNFKGLHYKTSFKEYQKAKWSPMAVSRILKNDIYIGNLVQGKEANISYRIRKKQNVLEENWIRVEGVHKAIIPDEIFSVTQKIMKMDTRTNSLNKGFYSGITYCSQCKRVLLRKDRSYICKDFTIKENTLNEIVFSLFHVYLQLIQLDHTNKVNVKKIDYFLKENQEGLKEYEKRRKWIEEDQMKKIISENEFDELEAIYAKRIVDLENSIKLWEEEYQNKEIKTEGIKRGSIVFFIDKIILYQGNRIEIKLN